MTIAMDKTFWTPKFILRTIGGNVDDTDRGVTRVVEAGFGIDNVGAGNDHILRVPYDTTPVDHVSSFSADGIDHKATHQQSIQGSVRPTLNGATSEMIALVGVRMSRDIEGNYDGGYFVGAFTAQGFRIFLAARITVGEPIVFGQVVSIPAVDNEVYGLRCFAKNVAGTDDVHFVAQVHTVATPTWTTIANVRDDGSPAFGIPGIWGFSTNASETHAGTAGDAIDFDDIICQDIDSETIETLPPEPNFPATEQFGDW